MKQAERVRLNDLSQAENSPQLVGCGRNAYCQQRIAGLGRRDQVADRANAADARHQRWHLGKRTPFAEFFESPELGYVEMGIFHTSLVVEEQGNLGVSLDAGNRVDNDGL